MAAAPTIVPLASVTSASDTVGAIPICDLPNKPTARPDVTRCNGLPETIKMEDVSVAEQAYGCREFPYSTVIPRLKMIIRSGITFVSRNVISSRFL